MINRLKIALGIPCYAQAKDLQNLVDSVPQGLFDEIVIVDDGSPEPLKVSESCNPFRIVRQDFNQGLAEARNRLVKETRSQILVFLDSDVVVGSISRPAIYEVFSDPLVGAVTGHVKEDGRGNVANRWRSHFWRQDHGQEPRRVNLVYGLCCAWRRSTIEQLGGFDPNLKTHGEDLDLSIRAARAGWRLVHEPSLSVTHCRRDNLLSLQKMVWNHSYAYSRVCRRYRHPDYWRALYNSLKWLPITVWSSLFRHHDPLMGAISISSGIISVTGRCVAGLEARGASFQHSETGGQR